MLQKSALITALFICILSPSCKLHDENKASVIMVKLPAHMEAYNPYIKNADSVRATPEQSSTLFIYTLVNVSCSTCILKLAKWNEFASEINGSRKGALSVRPICFSEDHFETLKFLFENKQIGKVDFPLLLDLDNKFIQENPGIVDKHAEMTVLTDAGNHVLLAGNPIENSKDRDLFVKKINEITE